MLRTQIWSATRRRVSARSVAPRQFARGAHVEYGPEQNLLTPRNIAALAIASGFIGLVWYDKFYATHLKPGKSSIGDWLIPSGPTRDQVLEHEDMMTRKALQRRQEMQTLFSADGSRPNLEENVRTYPVPEVEGKSIRPGRTLDLDKIDERRPRTVYFKRKDEEEQNDK